MFALFSTMTLGGLWHGAGLTFVAWGVMHGVGLCVALPWRTYKLPMTPVIGWPLTFLYVVLAWVLFRARSFDEAANIYAALFGHGKLGGVEIEAAITVAIAALASIAGPISWDWTQRLKPSPALGFAIAALAIISITRIADVGQQRFIYFQF
jgi:D-alanyl-lipoteichoic acid acyltransferase DltB (MBOAT superfamily)